MTEAESKKTVAEVVREQLSDPFLLKTIWDGRNVDPLLQSIINTSNRTGNNHAFTFTVGGNLVSGILISANEYYDQLAIEFSSQFETENGSAESVKFKILKLKQNPTDIDENAPAVQFVHLREAEVFTSNGLPIAPGGVLWRGKISSIDGWNVGRLLTSSNG